MIALNCSSARYSHTESNTVVRGVAAALAASCLLTACLLQPVVTKRVPGTIYLLPLGDSITQAERNRASYRYPLWSKLVSRGIPVDFVGSSRRHYKGLGPAREKVKGLAFDRDHEGHWGWRADEILTKLDNWLKLYPLDVALIHLGTNDVLQDQPVDETLNELAQIVVVLRKKNPSVSVLLAQPGQSSWPNAKALPDLAAGVGSLAESLSTVDSPVIAVPAADTLTVDKTYDGLHPAANGELALADAWISALDTLNLF